MNDSRRSWARRRRTPSPSGRAGDEQRSRDPAPGDAFLPLQVLFDIARNADAPPIERRLAARSYARLRARFACVLAAQRDSPALAKVRARFRAMLAEHGNGP